MVKIALKQKDDKEGIAIEALLNSSATGLVISSEFTRKNKFRKKKLDEPKYMRNIGSTSNYKGPIKYTVEVKLFYRGYKESIILGISWLVYYNLEINQKTEKVKITRCLDECGKQWKMKQTKLEWKKQREKEQKKEFRKLTVEKKNRNNKNNRKKAEREERFDIDQDSRKNSSQKVP